MELDKRIKALTDIQSVTNGCHDWEFMTKKGYFADNLEEFRDLTKCVYGEYMGYAEKDKCFTVEVRGNATQFEFRYFIPEADLKPIEKKYRPYSLTEWINQHEIGDVIHYRSKSEEIEAHVMYMGTYHHKNKGTIVLGVASYTLDCLFEDCEIEVNGEWQPFGIEVKDEE